MLSGSDVLAAGSAAVGLGLLSAPFARAVPDRASFGSAPAVPGFAERPTQLLLQWVPGQAGRAVERSAAATSDFAETWAAELRAGRPPGPGLRLAAAEVTDVVLAAALGPVVASVELGAEPAEGLRAGSRLPGCALLRLLAAAWIVGAAQGAALADAIDRIAETGRADLRQRREVAGHLAAPRATAWLLASLPAFGWLLGIALGADPFEFLLFSWAGRCCGGIGIVLVAAGLRWTSGLARRAQAPP